MTEVGPCFTLVPERVTRKRLVFLNLDSPIGLIIIAFIVQVVYKILIRLMLLEVLRYQVGIVRFSKYFNSVIWSVKKMARPGLC